MKEICFIIFFMILLTACGKDLDTQDKSSSNETTPDETATDETTEPTITFENRTVENEDFSLALEFCDGIHCCNKYANKDRQC
ncbi:hypothetical protein [Peribacillus simplex]|uniref:hypothetical protein n=1 Tax=Peribacillus simplex TaxID=1478 RepID=UPI000BA55EBF|nr:hypothetical protein [Peribacillus simplex]PAK43354.1 hypothetical protein CHI08_07055 [Peribacillus simplex]